MLVCSSAMSATSSATSILPGLVVGLTVSVRSARSAPSFGRKNAGRTRARARAGTGAGNRWSIHNSN